MNLFGRLVRRVKYFFASKEGRIELLGLDAADELIKWVKEYAPDGSENLDMFSWRFGERPSERLGEVPIKDGLSASWHFGARHIAGIDELGVNINVYSASPHVGFFTKGIPYKWPGGTAPHRIPLYGERYLQPDKDGTVHPLAFYMDGQDRWIWTHVNHPGIYLDRDFLEDAYDAARPRIREMIMQRMRDGEL